MLNFLISIEGAAVQGILWGILALGVFITFRVLDFADLSVEGTFALGGSVAAILITKGMNPFLVMIFSLFAGALAGMVTGLLHTVFKIPPILSGILTMIALYSINIRIMDDKATLQFIGADKFTTISSNLVSKLIPSIPYNQIDNIATGIVGIIFVAIVIAVLYIFFGTEIGSVIRATGNNEYMVRALGTNTDMMKVIALMLSNGLVALSGAMVAQQQGYADVQMGVGAIVIGLASVIIGEVIFCHKDHSFAYKLTAIVLGSVIYRIIVAVALRMGLKANDLKLITAIIVALALGLPVIVRKIKTNSMKKKIKKSNSAKEG